MIDASGSSPWTGCLREAPSPIHAVLDAVDDGLGPDPEWRESRLRSLRENLLGLPAADRERVLWEAVMEALEAERYETLTRTVLEAAEHVEGMGQLAGAQEVYRTAYRLAMELRAVREGQRAAQGAGRVCQRRPDLEAAAGWYRVALGLARCRGDRRSEAALVDLLAGVERRWMEARGSAWRRKAGRRYGS